MRMKERVGGESKSLRKLMSEQLIKLKICLLSITTESLANERMYQFSESGCSSGCQFENVVRVNEQKCLFECQIWLSQSHWYWMAPRWQSDNLTGVLHCLFILWLCVLNHSGKRKRNRKSGILCSCNISCQGWQKKVMQMAVRLLQMAADVCFCWNI